MIVICWVKIVQQHLHLVSDVTEVHVSIWVIRIKCLSVYSWILQYSLLPSSGRCQCETLHSSDWSNTSIMGVYSWPFFWTGSWLMIEIKHDCQLKKSWFVNFKSTTASFTCHLYTVSNITAMKTNPELRVVIKVVEDTHTHSRCCYK